MFSRINLSHVHLVLRHDIRFVSSDETELHDFIITFTMILSLVKDDSCFTNITLIYRIRAERTLLPSVLLLKVEVLEQTCVAENMAALSDSGSDDKPCRLHTDGTLCFLVGGVGSWLSVNDLYHIFPLDYSTRIIQVLYIPLLLVLDDLHSFVSLLSSFICGVGGLGDDAIALL